VSNVTALDLKAHISVNNVGVFVMLGHVNRLAGNEKRTQYAFSLYSIHDTCSAFLITHALFTQ
jgi:hypothetical protein